MADAQTLFGAMPQPPATSWYAGTPELPRLVSVHIAKNAGSSVSAWAYGRRVTFNPVPMARCNSTLGRGGDKWFGAPTWEHCVNSYTTNENQSGFCILRDPLERLVSEYNHASGRGCSNASLDHSITSTVAHGSGDNHDVMQIEYAAFCDFFLCFNALQADWQQLLSRAHVLRQPSKGRFGIPRVVIDRPQARDDPAYLPSISYGHKGPLDLRDVAAIANSTYTRLPVVRRGAKGSCHRSDVGDEAARRVGDYYASDYALYTRACVDTDATKVPFWSRSTAVGSPTREHARQLLASAPRRFSFGETNRWPAYDALLSETAAAMPLRQFGGRLAAARELNHEEGLI